jgi:hypothetical protein
VILGAAHQDQKRDLETLTVSPGLAHGAGVARTANVEVAGLEEARAIGDLDGTLPVVSLVTDVSKPFFAVIGAEARHLVDDLGVEARRLLFSDDAKVLLGEIKRLDNCVAPRWARRSDKCRRRWDDR